jgi:hypothetical protein
MLIETYKSANNIYNDNNEIICWPSLNNYLSGKELKINKIQASEPPHL